jgi:hypothetical protein
MKLFKVIIQCRTPWMDNLRFLEWAIMADSPTEAIEKIKDKFDLDGVIIYNEKAEEVEYLVLNTF